MKNDFGQFSEELLELAHEMWEYRTCQRSDGSYYGTAGQCRKGTPTTPGSDEKKSGGSLKVGGASGYKDVTDTIKADVGERFDAKHEKVFQDRYAGATDTKKLGSIHRKAIKDLDNDDLDAKEGVLNSMKKAMASHLEANQASGKGAKRAKELESMSPEDRKRATTSDRIQRGIKNKVVSGRRK